MNKGRDPKVTLQPLLDVLETNGTGMISGVFRRNFKILREDDTENFSLYKYRNESFCLKGLSEDNEFMEGTFPVIAFSSQEINLGIFYPENNVFEDGEDNVILTVSLGSEKEIRICIESANSIMYNGAFFTPNQEGYGTFTASFHDKNDMTGLFH